MSSAWTIAAHVLRDAIRTRTVLAVGALFAVLTLVISYFGLLAGGVLELQALNRTALSLTSLLLYLVPLVALVQGTAALSGSGGWLQLLMAQPVSRAALVVGEFVGNAGAVGGAVWAGVSLGAGVVWLRAGGDGAALAVLAATGLALALVFTALGVAIGAALPRRGPALAAALTTWFALVVLYDLLVLGLTAVLNGAALERALVLAAVANPVDAARVVALGAFVGETLFGATGAAVEALLGAVGRVAMAGVVLLWTGVSLAVAILFFHRREA